MVDKDLIKNIEKLEIREEKYLQREYHYLNKLHNDIIKKNKGAADKIIKRVESYGVKLERIHRRVFEALEALKTEGHKGDVANKLQKIENEINYYREDFENKTSRDTRELEELINLQMWDEVVEYVINNLKQDIKTWLALDKKLIELEEEIIY